MPYLERRCPKCCCIVTKRSRFSHCFPCRERQRLELADTMDLMRIMEEGR
jgi:hypothetical protein